MSLPLPSPEATAHSRQLIAAIRREIGARGGWIPFARFMEMVLYQPGLGYYAAGARKFGAAGDFVTAPEMSPFFGRALANQVAQVMNVSAPLMLEVGAGSGRLAADLLLELERIDKLPQRYDILDLSADLRERQQLTLAAVVPHLLPRVNWLDCLPEEFSGAIVANELLDAMPAHVVAWREAGIFERGVQLDEAGGFTWNERPASGSLLAAAEEIGAQCSLPPGYESEISLAARAWAGEWGHRLRCGALLL
ncbi:MAG: SAM-dependent methyltransferase, partial [Gallionella sp.]